MILFVVATIMTMKIDSPADGNDLIGFPLKYYEYLGGKRNPEPPTRHIYNYGNLIIDIAIIAIISICIVYIIKKIKKNVT